MVRSTLTFVVLGALLCPAASRAADSTYAIDKTDATLMVGEKGKASVTISARSGWHLNAEAPLTLKLAPAPGLAVDKPKLVRADLALSSEKSARFDVAVTASEPGKKAIEAEAGFVLCQDDACRPIKEKLTLAVDAVAPGKIAPAKKPAKQR